VDFAGENRGGIYLDAVFMRTFPRQNVCCGEVVDFGGGLWILWCEADGEFVVSCGGMRGKRGVRVGSFLGRECGTGFLDLFLCSA
jgi:hypothetical protein